MVEAVVQLDEAEIVETESCLVETLAPSLCRTLEARRVAAGQGQVIVDVDGGAKADGLAPRRRHAARSLLVGQHQGGGAVAHERAVSALERWRDVRIPLRDGPAEVEAEILAHLGVGVVHAILVVLRRDGGERVALVAMALEIPLRDAAEHAREARGNVALLAAIGGAEQVVADLRARRRRHLLSTQHEREAPPPSREEVARPMDRGRAGGAGVLVARRWLEAQFGHAVDRERTGKVLAREACVEEADEDSIHVAGRDAGVLDGATSDARDQRLDVRLIELAEGSVCPANDAGRHKKVSSTLCAAFWAAIRRAQAPAPAGEGWSHAASLLRCAPTNGNSWEMRAMPNPSRRQLLAGTAALPLVAIRTHPAHAACSTYEFACNTSSVPPAQQARPGSGRPHLESDRWPA